MKKLLSILGAACFTLSACNNIPSQGADQRQAVATAQSLDNADRQIGMPRIVNFSQRKLLKNAYEDMDQTTLTYVYVQAAQTGQFICLGQAVGYGVSLGTSFTAPTTPDLLGSTDRGIYARPQAEPNGLFMPDEGSATIVNLVNPANGEAHTALVEPNVITVPFQLPANTVSVPCPGAVDPHSVHDAHETSTVQQHN